MPEGEGIALELKPRLASWEARDHPDQVSLREWLAHVGERVEPQLDRIPGPLVVRLDVGLPEDADPLWQRDLDNYLDPIARELPGRVVSFWARKGRGLPSAIAVEPARETGAPDWPWFDVGRASGSEHEWKRAVHEAVREAAELPEGPAGLVISLSCGPGRSWIGLWKRTIDALDALLGRSFADKEWDPQDGRVVRLGLNRRLDPEVGHDVEATIWAAPGDLDWSELAWLKSMTADQRAAFLAERRGRQSKRRRPGERAPARPAPVLGGHQPPPAQASGVVEFRGDDRAYCAWIAANESGWVVNARRNPGAEYLQLHRAWCPSISEARREGAYTERGYVKFCAARRSDLMGFFEERLGARPRWNCRRCG